MLINQDEYELVYEVKLNVTMYYVINVIAENEYLARKHGEYLVSSRLTSNRYKLVSIKKIKGETE